MTANNKKMFKKIAVVAIIFISVFSGYPGTSFNKIQTAYALLNDATIEVLGGGGGGGILANSGGGGGGGGEYRRCTETLTVQSYTVTVGVGGTANNTGETDSSFSGTGISMTADGGNGSASMSAGTAGTAGSSTNCDTAVANFDGGTPGAGNTTADGGGGGGGGAGYGGKGGNGASASTAVGGGGGEGAGESAAGNNAGVAPAAGSGGSADGGDGGAGGNGAVGSAGSAGVPATFHIVGGGGGGGGDNGLRGGACGAPGAGSGGGEVSGAGNGCRGEVRIIYVDSEIDATGGTETTSGSFRIHTFTSSGTFTVNSISANVFTVTTNTETNVTTGSATMNGEIAATGGSNATARGFAWGTDSTLATVFATTTESGDFGTGTFSQNLSGLLSGVTYYFRAYATNPSGTAYGSIDNLVTSTNTTPNRRIRLFQGYTIKVLEGGRMIIR
jgi:hypothetical protein